eukprot:12414502-Alexandrium_andersonii.AAC.1
MCIRDSLGTRGRPRLPTGAGARCRHRSWVLPRARRASSTAPPARRPPWSSLAAPSALRSPS